MHHRFNIFGSGGFGRRSPRNDEDSGAAGGACPGPSSGGACGGATGGVCPASPPREYLPEETLPEDDSPPMRISGPMVNYDEMRAALAEPSPPDSVAGGYLRPEQYDYDEDDEDDDDIGYQPGPAYDEDPMFNFDLPPPTPPSPTPDFEKSWDPSRPTPVDYFRYRQKKDEWRFSDSRPRREHRVSSQHKPPAHSQYPIMRGPPNFAIQLAKLVEDVLAILKETSQFKRLFQQQQAFNNFHVCIQKLKEIRTLYNRCGVMRKAWSKFYDTTTEIMGIMINEANDHYNNTLDLARVSYQLLHKAVYLQRILEPGLRVIQNDPAQLEHLRHYHAQQRLQESQERLQTPKNVMREQSPPRCP